MTSAATFDPSTPTPELLIAARKAAGLTQTQAAALAGLGVYHRWKEYEAGTRSIDVARWELFLLKAGLHPTHKLVPAR